MGYLLIRSFVRSHRLLCAASSLTRSAVPLRLLARSLSPELMGGRFLSMRGMRRFHAFSTHCALWITSINPPAPTVHHLPPPAPHRASTASASVAKSTRMRICSSSSPLASSSPRAAPSRSGRMSMTPSTTLPSRSSGRAPAAGAPETTSSPPSCHPRERTSPCTSRPPSRRPPKCAFVFFFYFFYFLGF